LDELGIKIEPEQTLEPISVDGPRPNTDIELRDFEKLVRYFMRSTHISEGVMVMKLKHQGRAVMEQTLRDLLQAGVLQEVEHTGGGSQRRFRLALSLRNVNEALIRAKGNFQGFLSLCQNGG
jgi:hypothetical protein